MVVLNVLVITVNKIFKIIISNKNIAKNENLYFEIFNEVKHWFKVQNKTLKWNQFKYSVEIFYWIDRMTLVDIDLFIIQIAFSDFMVQDITSISEAKLWCIEINSLVTSQPSKCISVMSQNLHFALYLYLTSSSPGWQFSWGELHRCLLTQQGN